jgi:hypothetical protein
MTPFEFGQLVGSEKRAEGAPAGHGVERALHFASKAPTQAMGGLLGAGVGAGVGIGNMGFRGVSSVARGMDSGINAGTRVMDKMMGGPATGIGGKMLRAPAQAVGAAAGAIGGAVRAPFSALGGVAHDTYQGARKGVNIAGRLSDAALPAPSYAGQQPKTANALATVAKPLVGEIVRRAPIQAKALPRAAQATAQAGGNAMKYLGAGAAGLAGGVIGSKMMGGKQEQQPKPKVASIAQQPGQNFDPMAMNMGAANTFASQQKPQVPFGTGQQNQKINLGGGKDMLSQGMGALQNSIEAMKKRFPPSHMGSQI